MKDAHIPTHTLQASSLLTIQQQTKRSGIFVIFIIFMNSRIVYRKL